MQHRKKHTLTPGLLSGNLRPRMKWGRLESFPRRVDMTFEDWVAVVGSLTSRRYHLPCILTLYSDEIMAEAEGRD